MTNQRRHFRHTPDQDLSQALLAKLKSSGYVVEPLEGVAPWDEFNYRDGYWEIDISTVSGGVTKHVVGEEDQGSFARLFDNKVVRVDGYVGLHVVGSATIEIELATGPELRGGLRGAISTLPGYTINNEKREIDARTFESVTGKEIFPYGWVYRASNDDYQIEISARSPTFAWFFGNGWPPSERTPTIKVTDRSGAGTGARTDELVVLARDFIVDLEFKTSLEVWLHTVKDARSIEATWRRDVGTPTVPINRYDEDAASLFWYGMEARDLPLLQFLAFYQVLEFYFARSARKDAIERIQTELRHPAFAASKSADVDRLIDLSRNAHSSSSKEEQQLLITIRRSVDASKLRSFIFDDPVRLVHFTATVQAIANSTPIVTLADEDIYKSTASHIYRVRNRIVHMKQVDNDGDAQLLMPRSAEARFMGPEIELVKWLAQHVMVAAAASRL